MRRDRNETPDFQTSQHVLGFDEPRIDSHFFAKLVKPQILLYAGSVLLGIALVLILPKMNLLGYIVGVLSSIAFSGSLLRDQRLQATSDYVFLKWFRPTVVCLRVLTFLVSFAHIISLALEKAR